MKLFATVSGRDVDRPDFSSEESTCAFIARRTGRPVGEIRAARLAGREKRSGITPGASLELARAEVAEALRMPPQRAPQARKPVVVVRKDSTVTARLRRVLGAHI